MTKRRKARGWTGTMAAALVAGGLGLSVVGCNAGGGGLSAAAQGEAMAAAAIQGGAIPSLLAIQQALAEVHGAGVFPDVSGLSGATCGTVTTTGSTASGTVDFTFPGGAGCPSAYGSLDSGTFGATYSAPTTNTVSVATTFSNTFKVTATGSDTQTVNGSLSTTLTVNATAKTASGPLDGTITHTGPGGARTLLFALTSVALDSSTPTKPTATLNGKVTIDDPQLGQWTVRLTDVVVDYTGCITSGEAKASRLDILIFEFTGCNNGDVLLAGIKVGTFRW